MHEHRNEDFNETLGCGKNKLAGIRLNKWIVLRTRQQQNIIDQYGDTERSKSIKNSMLDHVEKHMNKPLKNKH